MPKLKFVDAVPPVNQRPLHIYLKSQGDFEIEVHATDGKTDATILGIRAEDGTVVRYGGQKAKLLELGFAEVNGLIGMFN
jgi:hypothetical protein